MLLSLVLNVQGATTSRTINVSKAGTLPSLIAESERSTIEVLKLTGSLNGSDIEVIRQMGNLKLRKLDISSVNIVSGGELYTYYEGETKPRYGLINVSSPIAKELFKSTEKNTVSAYMFADLSKLQELILPNSITTIEEGAFVDCPALKSIVLGSQKLTKISEFLFYGCNALTTVSINQTTTASPFVVANGAIYNRSKTILVAALPGSISGTFNVPSTVDSIAPFAFAGCRNMNVVSLPTKMSKISDHAFAQSGLKSVSLPQTVKHVGIGSFCGCENLSSVKFTSAIERIDAGAFAYCNLTEADLSMTKVSTLVGDYHSVPVVPLPTYSYSLGIFEGNTRLNNLKFPASMTEIGGKTTSSASIENVYSYAIVPPVIWYDGMNQTPSGGIPIIITGYTIEVSDTFNDIAYSNCTLHVPSGSRTAYQNAWGWSQFGKIVEDLPGATPTYDADWLQEQLDAVAAKGTSTANNPTVVELPQSGVTITHPIYVRNGCHATLKGGNIQVAQNFTGTVAFLVNTNNSLTFTQTSLLLNNHSFAPSIIDNSGQLTFGSGFGIGGITTSSNLYSIVRSYQGTVTFQQGEFYSPATVISCVSGGFTTVIVNGGQLKTNGYYSVVEGSCSLLLNDGWLIGHDGAHYVVDITGEVYMYGGNISGARSNCLVRTSGAQTTYNGGSLTGGYETELHYATMDVQSGASPITVGVPVLRVCSVTNRISGDIDLTQTKFYLNRNTHIVLSSSIKQQWTIDGEWSYFSEGSIVVSSYTAYYLTAQDFGRMQFLNLPSDLEAYYDSTDYTVKLRKKSGDGKWSGGELNNYMNDKDGGDIPASPGGYDIDVDVNIPEGTDWKWSGIDGQNTEVDNPEQLPNYPWAIMQGGNVNVGKRSTLTIKNVGFDAQGTSLCIYVNGTLTIDINVAFRNFSRYFVYVRPGGKLIWRGGKGNINGIVVYNEGGTVEWTGGKATGRNGTIHTAGDFYLDGKAQLSDITLLKGGRVVLTSKLQYTMKVSCTDTSALTDGQSIVVGGQGYRVTNSDFGQMQFILPADFTAEYDSATYSVVIRRKEGQTPTNTISFAQSGYATFYDSQSAYTLNNGMTAYVVTAISNNKLTYRQIAGGSTGTDVIPKGVAVMLRISDGMSLTQTLTATTRTASYSGTNLLRGSDVATTTTGSAENNLFYKLTYGHSTSTMANVFGWYWGSDNGGAFSIAAHRAWLCVPSTAGSRQDGFAVDATAVNSPTVTPSGDSRLYDLQGRRLTTVPDRGVYIRNGRKVIIK